MSHLAPYQPVSCKMHSELEWAIMQAKSLKLTYYKDINTQKITQIVKPIDLITQKNKGEFLLCVDNNDISFKIRLDLIEHYDLN